MRTSSNIHIQGLRLPTQKMKEMPALKTARASIFVPLCVQKCRSSECKKKN